MMDCLEGHRYTDGFGPDCRSTLETAMEARAMDFRLDAPLRQASTLLTARIFVSSCQGPEQDSAVRHGAPHNAMKRCCKLSDDEVSCCTPFARALQQDNQDMCSSHVKAVQAQLALL
jgi:hypothetical protein